MPTLASSSFTAPYIRVAWSPILKPPSPGPVPAPHRRRRGGAGTLELEDPVPRALQTRDAAGAALRLRAAGASRGSGQWPTCRCLLRADRRHRLGRPPVMSGRPYLRTEPPATAAARWRTDNVTWPQPRARGRQRP